MTNKQLDIQVWREVWTKDTNLGVMLKYQKVVFKAMILLDKISRGGNRNREDMGPRIKSWTLSKLRG